METVGFIRRQSWRNAGFGSLVDIREYIEHTEPRFDPTVYPLEEESSDSKEGVSESEEEQPQPLTGQRKYSTVHYRSLYLSGELTPLEVVQAILPLIRRDLSPPGIHSQAWYDIKLDLVLKSAEASTLRYKEKRSLGPLDGVPTAVKEEFDMEGYLTMLGSLNDYTSPVGEGESISAWCVKKVIESGAIVLGKVAMHEFGMGNYQSSLPFI